VVGLNLFANDLSELFGRLRGLQVAVKADRRLNAPMPEQPPDRFIIARSVLEINRGRRVSELVHGDSKSYCLLYPLTNTTLADLVYAAILCRDFFGSAGIAEAVA
jgi:hypothetical protein